MKSLLHNSVPGTLLLFMAVGTTPIGAWAASTVSPEGPERSAQSRRDINSMEKKGWKLTFQDEFNGSRLDRSRWIDSYPYNVRTHSNGELQYYGPDGWKVRNGCLALIGEKREMKGKPYTSGMVASYPHFAQKYGWFEIRVKIPRGKGYWPAFWLLPNNLTWPPEIDVLEILGHEPDKVYTTNHWRDETGHHGSKGGSFKGPDFSAGFHTYAVDWEPGSITWYVDGTERFRVTERVPSQPMYIIANLAVGGDWPGNPDATTHFPGAMLVDYIRAYSRAK